MLPLNIAFPLYNVRTLLPPGWPLVSPILNAPESVLSIPTHQLVVLSPKEMYGSLFPENNLSFVAPEDLETVKSPLGISTSPALSNFSTVFGEPVLSVMK